MTTSSAADGSTGSGATGHVLGIDIGGTHVKASVVEVEQGRLVGERMELDTPEPGTPEQIGEVVAEIARSCSWTGAVGVAFPGVVEDGVVREAPNLDDAWEGTDLQDLVATRLGVPREQVATINDADAAGLAEGTCGSAAGVDGVAVLVTLGTGVGTALLVGGLLAPNTELGEITIGGLPAQDAIADHAWDRRPLDEWAADVCAYLAELERMVHPEVVVIGGGISERFDEYAHHLHAEADIRCASAGNDAGIVGAALAHRRRQERA